MSTQDFLAPDVPGNVVPALNVKSKEYEAKGDGQSDDYGAIQKALNEVGQGNTVFFPPGNYAISKALTPRSRTQMLGVHVPVYSTGPQAQSNCKISLFPGKDFKDGAAIKSDGAFGVEIRNLALDGFRQAAKTTVHGIDQGPKTGERGWTLEHVTIHGFNGSGLFGRWHVATLYDVHVARNAGWGVNAGTNSSNWNDVRFVACQFYFNGLGNVWLGGTTERSAAIDFIGCRSERAGINRENVSQSILGAPGWRISRGARINLVGCSTDANAGNGVEIVPMQKDDAANLYLIQIVGSSFGRDGCVGDKVVPDRAGIKVMAANQVRIVGCSINTGSAQDVGVPNDPLDPAATVGYFEGPKYGIWCSDIHYVDIIANNVQGTVKDFRIESTAYRGNIQDMRNGLFTIPERSQSELPDPSMVKRGMTIWHVGMKKPLWYDGNQWLDAMGAAVLPGE